MFLRGRVLALPKRGNSADEFEDAYSPAEIGQTIPLPFVCAIADGATESSFSNIWAKLLTAEFVACGGDLDVMDVQMPRLRMVWHGHVTDKPLPWYAEQKLEQGAFATILGVVIEPGDDEKNARWRAFAVGDSCLFHVKADGRVLPFPVERAEQLCAWPYLVPSRPMQGESLHVIGCSRRGTLELGDKLILVTDAIAGWLLRSIEEQRSPLQSLAEAAQNMGAFLKWVDGLRDSGQIKNDDCTMLWLESCEQER